FVQWSDSPRDLPAFPTRRSSDLTLRITADRPRATVAVDGREALCATPCALDLATGEHIVRIDVDGARPEIRTVQLGRDGATVDVDRKSTRLNSSHSQISYAVFCL